MKPLMVRYRIAKKSGKILDVGCGNNPFEQATHLVDLYPKDNAERGGNLEIPSGATFREGDLESIPFSDRDFDFVHASHVLEHAQSPEKAISELIRVGHAGYIETPSAMSEQISFFDSKEPGWSFHRWYVWTFPKGTEHHGKLFLKPKTAKSNAHYCGCEWGQKAKELGQLINFKDLEPHLPYYGKMTQFIWEEQIPFSVWGEEQNGVLGKSGLCDCHSAAFFAHCHQYLGELRHLRRRWQFRRKQPHVFQFVKAAAHVSRRQSV